MKKKKGQTVLKEPLRTLRARCIRVVSVILLIWFCSVCATVREPNPKDPFESFNRGVYQFNYAIDKAVVRPAATIYRDAIPEFVRGMVGNFVGNLADVWSLANSVLQGKGAVAATTFMRINVNTVFGLGGLLDVASEMRLPQQDEDFGQTLGYWGFPSGPYLVVPFLGSTTVRDFLAWPVDAKGDILSRVHDVAARNTIKALDVLDTRVDLLALEHMLNDAALDRYSFVRDGFLQRRRNAVFDGDPPDEDSAEKSRAP